MVLAKQKSIGIVGGLPTFAVNHYHRPRAISLLSSRWDQVEQAQYSPLTMTTLNLIEELRKEIKGKTKNDLLVPLN